MHRNKQGMVPVLLWLFAMGIVVRMTIFVRQRSSSQFTEVDTNALVEIVLVGLTAAVLLFAPRARSVWKVLWRTSGGLLVAYYVLCAATALWSPLPDYSLFRAVETLSQYVAVVVALSYCASFEAAEKRVLAVSVVAVVLGLISTLQMAGFAVSLDALHTNSYTASAAVLCCYCGGELAAARGKRGRMLRLFGLAGLAAVVAGTSSASIIATLCGGLVGFTMSRRYGVLLSALAVFAMVTAYMLAGDVIEGIVFPGKTDQQIRTMTGRTQLWEAYAEEIKENPLLGKGFGVGPRLSTFRYTTNAHNSIFAVLLSAGAVGMAVAAAGGLKLWREVRYCMRVRRPGGAGCAAAMTAAVVNSMGLPIIGESWMVPSLVVACVLGLHLLFVLTVAPPEAAPVHQAAEAGTTQDHDKPGTVHHGH
ncbi:MAG TPA: O-antigen ligase family protein [Planctomycetota bacterium]|nr:O-antigen ligase family protein [Planctomycetota bacterium]